MTYLVAAVVISGNIFFRCFGLFSGVLFHPASASISSCSTSSACRSRRPYVLSSRCCGCTVAFIRLPIHSQKHGDPVLHLCDPFGPWNPTSNVCCPIKTSRTEAQLVSCGSLGAKTRLKANTWAQSAVEYTFCPFSFIGVSVVASSQKIDLRFETIDWTNPSSSSTSRRRMHRVLHCV